MYRFRCISTTKPIVGTSTCPIPGTGSIGRRSMCSWPCTRRWSDSQCNVCSCQKTNSTGFITVSGNIWEYMFMYDLILFRFGLSCTLYNYVYVDRDVKMELARGYEHALKSRAYSIFYSWIFCKFNRIFNQFRLYRFF